MKLKFNALIGDESKFTLEHRILNIALIFGIAICFISSIVNYFINMNTSIALSGGLVLVCLYYLSIIRKKYAIPMLIALFMFTFVVIPIMWFYGAGTLGGFQYLIILFSSIIAILLSGPRRPVFICCLIIIIVTLIAVEYRYPYLIIGYSTNEYRFLDISFGLIITIISNTLLFVVVVNNYNEEHKKAKEYNEQLQQEIAERKQVEAQLKYLATHDYLTNVLNRYSFEESLKKTVAKAKRGKESFLLFIDIDNFKMVNDTKGHSAGDKILIIVAKTIKENIRESDTLARLGGDEFGVLLEGATVSVAKHAAEKLRQKIEDLEFRLINYDCFNLSLSIGVVMIDGTLNSQKLLTLADTALYAAKEKGRNRVLLLDPNEEITTKFTIINQLVGQVKNAIKEDKFVLHFQPVVRVDNGKILHHEVLLRLKGEDGELIYPNTFIPAAERFGLMPNIDRWVIRSSLNILRQHPDLSLFVNISGISLSEESLVEYIEEMITGCGMEPSRIGFEITETTAVKDMLLAQRWIERLKKLGCQFALDDFGIGFSSFSYLRMLPVDYLKIDGSFIRNLDQNPSHRALVKAINTVAQSMGKKTIAEYVENENDLKALQELKIDCAQGYFLYLPTTINKISSANTTICTAGV